MPFRVPIDGQKKNIACFRNNRDRHTMVRRPSEAALSLAPLSATQISKIAVRLLLAFFMTLFFNLYGL